MSCVSGEYIHIFVLFMTCQHMCLPGGVVNLLSPSLHVAPSSLQLVPYEPSQGTYGWSVGTVPDNDWLPSVQHP